MNTPEHKLYKHEYLKCLCKAVLTVPVSLIEIFYQLPFYFTVR